jgi:hypothetical protein
MSLPNVPSHLTIRVLHSDDDIVVIDKPCDLRSVPGHANPPPQEEETPRSNIEGESLSHRRTAQEAWVKAIELMSVEDDGSNNANATSMEDASVREVIRNLRTTADPSCVPRKLDTFVKYCQRNQRRLLPSFTGLRDREEGEPSQKKPKSDTALSSKLREIGNLAHARIQQNQRGLMNLPKPTEDWESAIGQLCMFGFGDYTNCVSIVSNYSEETKKNYPECTNESKLYVVHRLDCQVSQA